MSAASSVGERTAWLAPFLGYAAIAAAFASPAGERLTHELIGGGDNLEWLWNAWWLDQSLLRFENPWFSEWLFAPEGTPLVWHSLAPIPSCAVALLSRVLPLTVAYNAVVLLALPIAGTAAFALCRHLTRDAAASFAGGAVFMLSPFIVSKTLGHLDLLYGGLLPWFALCLLLALEDRGGAGARALSRRAWLLAGASLLLLFSTSPNVPIFAMNFALLLFLRQLTLEPFAFALRRFTRVFAPTAVLALPYAAVVAFYAFAWRYPPRMHGDRSYDPELVAYLLPFTPTSMHSAWPRSLGLAGLDGIEPAVYLGVAVLPLALAGLWWRRRDSLARWLALGLALFFVFSMGPKLVWQREVVEIAGFTVYLPFGLWRWVPVLGSVGQAGRYAILVYLVLAVGLAYAVAQLAARMRASRGERAGTRAALAVAAAATALVFVDYAFELVTSPLPRALSLSPAAADRTRVLDPRLGSAPTMYQQTLHRRPLVGGYVSRPPPAALARYAADPVLGWLFAREPGPPPERALLVGRLAELEVGDVMLAPRDPRGPALAARGFLKRDENDDTVVWSRPDVAGVAP